MALDEAEGREPEPEQGGTPDAAVRLRAGARLFDEARYEEAHEELEHVWLASEGGDADFFKGLIQAAICLHHFQRGNLAGARRLYSGHRRYLGAYLPRHRAVDVEAFLADMQAFLRPVLRATADARVPFERDRRPRLRIG